MRRTGSRDAHAALYDRMLAVERIEAAVATAACLPFPFTLTARAECYLSGHPNPFEESVARAASYRDAGADCLYVPGITDAATIGRLVKEVDVVMGALARQRCHGGSLASAFGEPDEHLYLLNQLEDLGVKRVSIGGSLARATFGRSFGERPGRSVTTAPLPFQKNRCRTPSYVGSLPAGRSCQHSNPRNALLWVLSES